MTYMVQASGPNGTVVDGPVTLEKAIETAHRLTLRGFTEAFVTQCNTMFEFDVAKFSENPTAKTI